MKQIIDLKKLHNYSASQLANLVEEVLQGAADLVAQDGLPRNLSSLLKFEGRIRGTFANSEAGVTDQLVYVKPRMLKDIKVNINKDDFTFVNETASTAPKLSAAAQESEEFDGWTTNGAFYLDESTLPESAYLPYGALTLSGVRLAPAGWDSNCKISFAAIRGTDIFRFDRFDYVGDDAFGVWALTPSVASDNALKFNTNFDGISENSWAATTVDPSVPQADAAIRGTPTTEDPTGLGGSGRAYVPTSGDKIVFSFIRQLADGSGSIVATAKEYTFTL